MRNTFINWTRVIMMNDYFRPPPRRSFTAKYLPSSSSSISLNRIWKSCKATVSFGQMFLFTGFAGCLPLLSYKSVEVVVEDRWTMNWMVVLVLHPPYNNIHRSRQLGPRHRVMVAINWWYSPPLLPPPPSFHWDLLIPHHHPVARYPLLNQ